MRFSTVILILVLLAGCSSSPEMQVINGAADAMGGKAAIQAANTLIVEGTGENFNFGQNMSPDADLPKYTVTEFKRSLDFANGRWRQEQTRVPTFVTANTAPQKQIAAVDGNVGFNVAADGNATRTAEDVAKDRRAELTHHPLGFLRAAMAQGAQLSNARKEAGADAVDLTVDGNKYTLFVDSATKLPSKAVSMTYDVNLGDIALETSFGNYADVKGLKLPGKITLKRDKWVTADINVGQQSVNGDVGDLAAPAKVKDAPAPVLTANVTVEEVSKGIWFLAGQSHHSVLVEFGDHLTLIEAPQNEVRALAVIQKAREIKPDKPLTQVVNTHHHFDHSGGIRAAVSEGLTVITHEANKAFYEDVVARKHTIMQDALAKNPKPLSIETVKDKQVLEDPTRKVELYHIDGNPHAATLLMVYFPAERLLIEADMYTPPAQGAPPPPGFPFARNTAENIEKNNLRVDRILPIHGFIVPFKDFQTAVQAERKKAASASSN